MKLTEAERRLLSRSADGGPHVIKPVGLGEVRVARKLAALGLGTMVGKAFIISATGVASLDDFYCR